MKIGTVIFTFIAILLAVSGLYFFNEKIKADAQQKYEASQASIAPATREELLTLVNAERTKAGIAPLQIDDKLNQSAQIKVDDMLANNYYAHANPTTGKQGAGIAYDYMNECRITGENLMSMSDMSRVSSETAMQGWMGSESHRRAILDTKYNFVGFGLSNSIIVQHFCSVQ